LTANCGKITVKRKWKKQNIRYSAWNVNGIAHKEEELDSVLSEKRHQLRNQKEIKGALEINNYIVAFEYTPCTI